jgi:hypothetical protein
MILRDALTLIKHPALLFKYLLRERNLANFFGVEKGEVKAYLLEANQITYELALRLPKNVKLGTMISPLRGPIVYVCVRILKPDIMVETGVASGSSSAYILHAMDLNRKGFLYSIDLPNADTGASIPEGKQTGWCPTDLGIDGSSFSAEVRRSFQFYLKSLEASTPSYTIASTHMKLCILNTKLRGNT